MFDFLYPEISPFQTGHLKVSPVHEIYWEICGNPQGVPVIFLHGGPGGSCDSMSRRFFDPSYYKIILFDQRGCGKSSPFAEIQENSPQLLVQDMEKLRIHLNIDKWHIFGGSWGATLALLYATDFPSHVLSLVLRGIFTMTQREVDWMMMELRRFFPEAHERFRAAVCFDKDRAQDSSQKLVQSYKKRLESENPEIYLPAAKAWYNYELACSSLYPDALYKSLKGDIKPRDEAISLARIEALYFSDYVLPDDYFLSRIDQIRHIPSIIIQGRYDMICPIETADQLHLHWPEAQYQIIPDSGHAAFEPGTALALVQAMDEMRKLI